MGPYVAQYLYCAIRPRAFRNPTPAQREALGVFYLASGGSQSAGHVVNLWVGHRCVAFMFCNEVVEQSPRATPREPRVSTVRVNCSLITTCPRCAPTWPAAPPAPEKRAPSSGSS